ncbi:MAG TPA: hypothetical protein VNO30_18655 [Kofleriaceae bacterium]|nr:hypothetical protein [Kofleriaceae bacterium]
MGLPRAVLVILVVLAGLSGCESCGAEDPVDAPGPAAYTVSASWRVTDLGDVEIPCERVDGQFVTVTFFQAETGQSFTDVFDCFRKTGSRSLEAGEYLIGFDLADRLGTLVTLPPRRYVIAGDTALDEVKLPLDPFGDLVMTLETPLFASCGGGSQITDMTLELYRSDGSCQTSTLAIEPAATYPINCAAPMSAGCIEKDQRVTAAHFPADEYRIRVVALQGAMPCWLHDQRHRIRAAGLRRTVTLPLTKTCN